MLKQYKLENGKLIETDKKPLLLVYIAPNREEINYLIEEFGIAEYNINSALDPEEVSRVEFEDDHIIIILKRPKNYSTEDNLVFKVISTGIFFFKTQLIIILPENIQILEGRYLAKIKTLQDILLKFLHGTVSHFLGHLKAISMISDSLEKKMSGTLDAQYLLNMFALQKSMVYYSNGINSNITVVEKIKMSKAKFKLTEENIELLDDIIIDNNQCKKIIETYTNIFEIMIKAKDSFISNRLNHSMKRMTLIMTIFMPLTLIAGIGGMSEWSMITGPQNWYITYPLCFGGMVIIGIITYFIFKWKGWT